MRTFLCTADISLEEETTRQSLLHRWLAVHSRVEQETFAQTNALVVEIEFKIISILTNQLFYGNQPINAMDMWTTLLTVVS